MKSCDLQAVSIDPTNLTVRPGENNGIVVNMKNNGPDPLPIGEARVHVTVNGRFVDTPTLFAPIGGKWVCQLMKSENGLHEVFVTNIKELPVNETGFPGFQFSVKALSPGKVNITLVSSLSADATASDPNGTNQSVSTEFDVV